MNTQSRSFTALTLAAAALFLLSSSSAAQPPGKKGKGKPADNAQRLNGGGNAQGNPAEIATKMISEHDKNLDAELGVPELVAAMTAQRQQRPGQSDGMRGNDSARNANRGPQKGNRSGQRSGMQRQRGAQSGQRGGAARNRMGMQPGARPSNAHMGQAANAQMQMAAKLLTQFDKNGSSGLDAQELAASIESKRQVRSARSGPDQNQSAQRPGPGLGKGQGKGDKTKQRNRQEQGPAKGAGKGKGPGKGNAKNTEPGTGVVPKRPAR